MSPDEICDQIRYGQIPQDWAVFQPPQYPLVVLIFYGICYIAICPLICTASFSLLLWFLGQPEHAYSSVWSMYTSYPILVLIAIGCPFLLLWLGWWLEKRDRNTLLVLMPGGFIQYKPWNGKHKQRAKVIEYKDKKVKVNKRTSAGIGLKVQDKQGHHKQIFITRKYDRGASPQTTVHEEIVQRIISYQRRFHAQDMLQ